MVQASAALPVLRSASAVRHLVPEEARKEYPVEIRGVVTWVNVRSGELFVQDATAGIFVFIRNSHADRFLQAGQTVVVSGVTAPGDFSSSITRARIQVTGEGEMPASVRIPFERVLTGEKDSQWGHLEGVVRSGREDGGVLYLNAMAPGGTFIAILNDYPRDWSTRLVDSRVSLDGVLAAIFNEHRQVSGARIFVPGARFLRIEDAAPESPFDLPRSSALSVGAFRANESWNHRVHVRAAITAVVSKVLIYAAEGEGNLAIEVSAPCAGKPGSVADFVGFPGFIEGRPGLQNAACRVAPAGSELRPVELAARDILPPESPDEGSGLAIARGTRNDLKLVTVGGTLIQVARGAHSQVLTLASADQIFGVTLPESVSWMGDAMEPGSQMKVTGVCLITYDEFHRAQSFRLLARDATDITVQSRPSWLTIRRALWIMIPLALIVVGSIAWISVLRRHVAIKTCELRAANELLQQDAGEDALTGAANRRRFDEVLDTEVRYSYRTSTPLSLLMIDIDHFKDVNDLYGHQRGDQCLIEVVGALRRALFPATGMLVARYGGEEFAVVLPDTPANTAIAVAEQMRACVLELAISHGRSPFDQRLTVSLGVATLSAGSPWLAEHLVNKADRALYQAKQAGRNRVVAFSDGNDGRHGVEAGPKENRFLI
jgi:diguanylate cyclase (GGDEF)-like protein